MGCVGSALLFLSPSEMAYVDFLKINQKAPLEVGEYIILTNFNRKNIVGVLADQLILKFDYSSRYYRI